MTLASISGLAYLAVFLAIRGVFMWRMRREKAVSCNDAIDLGDSWSVTLEFNADHRLVTDGLYRRVRHPMYSSFLVLGVVLPRAAAT